MKTLLRVGVVGTAVSLAAAYGSVTRVQLLAAFADTKAMPDSITSLASRPLIVPARFSVTGTWTLARTYTGTTITVTGNADQQFDITANKHTCLTSDSNRTNATYNGDSLDLEDTIHTPAGSTRSLRTIRLDGEDLLIPEPRFLEFQQFIYTNTEISKRIAKRLAFIRADNQTGRRITTR